MFNELPRSADELKNQMLIECVSALKLNTYFDNYDAERYDFAGVSRSGLFMSKERAFWFNWFFENFKELFLAFELFEDATSRRLFLCIIAFRLAGHHSVKIPVEFKEDGIEWEEYRVSEKYTASALSQGGAFGDLKHFDFYYKGRRYVADCLGLKYYLHRRQYFYERENIVISPLPGDHVIDGGACLGDTGVVFGNAIGRDGVVYCFDPVHEHIEAVLYNAAQNRDLNIQAMPYGLSHIDIECEPLRLNSYDAGFNSNRQDIPLRAIDTLVIDGKIKKIDFIKLDVEGAELSAIKGSLGTIRKYSPKLAISLYHKPNDIFEIPLFLNAHFKRYKFYLGHYTIHNEETVLYCI